jgi:CDP-glycerol glycerophosphotransferase
MGRLARWLDREHDLRRRLVVEQLDGQLRLTIGLRQDAEALRLWVRCADHDQWWPMAEPVRIGRGHVVRVVLDDLPRCERCDDESTLHVFLEVRHEVRAGSKDAAAAESAPFARLAPAAGDRLTARYRLQLGRFADTDITSLSTYAAGDGRTVSPYPTKGGYLALAVNRPLNPTGAVYVDRVSLSGGVLRMQGRIVTGHGDLTGAELVVKGRSSGARASLPVRVTSDDRGTRRRYGIRRYRFRLQGDLGDLLGQGALPEDVLDPWMVLRTAQNPEPQNVRVGRTRFVARMLTRATSVRSRDAAAVVTPYYTYRARNLSLQVEVFEPDTLTFLERELRRRHLVRLAHARRRVWLVGERPYKAQDTGYHFFRYLRENHPEIDAYYVIEEGSPDRRNVDPLGNVVTYGSTEHIRLTLLAERVFGSHHPDFIYPVRSRRFRRAVRARKVFLQHGVMGTKWLVPMYGKGSGIGFETDLFVVSSEREKEYIVEDFGYDPDEVAVTGLSRFDALLAGDVPVRRQLLIMPTWRDWFIDTEIYLSSDYHRLWSALLHHPRLRALADEHGLEIVFCLHPNVQTYIGQFAGVPARVISQGEVDVQHLLKESAMLVTDYSSVGFDFSFLHKPVVYFQFDRARFLGPRGSHLDLDEELPGRVVYTVNQVLDAIEDAVGRGLTMEPEHVRRADRFLTHRDRGSSERIYRAALEVRPVASPVRRFLRSDAAAAAYGFVRRSDRYFPAVRVAYRLLQRLPADDSLIVFESGVGKQYADSPRYIYEELVRRGDPRTKIWAYTGKIHGRDEHTRTVTRLSPAYFYYLARARYWVNNQNFPHYVTRRADGVYLQTWHGTPLKRMLHDLDEVHGRDEGYVKRVSSSVRQWSALLSPSPFATSALRSAFRYDGPVLETGYPRNDVLVRPERDELARRVRHRLSIGDDKTVVLYAPTFRDDQKSGDRFTFSLPLDLERFAERFGDDHVLLLRMHVLVRGGVEIPDAIAGTVMDVSGYPEVQELFLASDVLVTDYSSVFFDYANLRRPMLFYAYDLESYRDTLRGFYLDYDADLPGPVVQTEDELYAALEDLENVAEAYAERYEQFVREYNPNEDGHAAERVVDALLRPPPLG